MNLLLGVSGSIALYKSCDLVRELKKKNHRVKVIMTRTAEKWISPTLFAALSDEPVYTSSAYQSMVGEPSQTMPHIDLRENTDVFLVAPATANIIGKAACGLADDILSSTLLSFAGKKWFAPAMNPTMYAHPIVQKNINTLKEIGYKVLEPIDGEAVCGDTGEGKMMKIEDIIHELESIRH